MKLVRLCLCFLLATSGNLVAADENSAASPAEVAKEVVTQERSFQLPALDGSLVDIRPEEEAKVTVVCFLGAECPLVKLYTPRLSAMSQEFASRGVRFVAVNSNRQDTLEDMQSYLREYSLPFPCLRDEGNVVADQYGATRTPEVFVLNSKFQVVYQGRIDNQYAPGVNRPTASQQELRTAIEQSLNDATVAVASTEAVGCMIGKIRKNRPASSGSSVTYSKDVSRVLQRHCVECHRTDEIGPFSLESFEDVVGWAETSMEVIDNGRMPPWHADSQHGSFANSRQMPEEDKQVLRDWIAAGLPEGDGTHLPEPATFATGWQAGQRPDFEFPMANRPYKIPAEGTVEYQYFVVDPGFTEEKWVTAAQVIPGNRSVVHHAIVFIRPPDDQEFRGVGWLTAYVPGQRMIPMPAGHARRVPAGSRFVFQMHYTTNGTPQEDLSRVGIVLTNPKNVSDEVITLIGIDQEFEIPPHAADHEVSGKIRWMPKNGKLLAIAPHMHVRGKSFNLYAEKDGQSETLLHVPQYDFNWQHSYVLTEPLPLSSVDQLTFRTTFDNSKKNPFNPDPTQWVNWGDQTWEEMAVVFLEVSEPLHAKDSSISGADTAAGLSEQPATSVLSNEAARLREKKITVFVEEFFERLDTNRDGVVSRIEAPVALRTQFSRYDANGDQIVERSEIRQIAERRF